MRSLRPLDAALVVGAAALTGVAVAVADVGWPEWAFGTVLLSSLALVAHLDGEALWRARSERRRVRQLLTTDLQEVADAAVVAERDRLAVDITVCLQASLQAILQESQRLDRRPRADPSAGLQRIQHHTRVASSELRRQLGLLHLPSAAAEKPRNGTRQPPAFHRMDLALGAAMFVLAIGEASIYPRLYPLPDWSIWSVPLTALAAATVVGRSVAPALAAAACAGAFLVGALLHLPVVTGLWVLGTVCVLLWTLTSSWTDLRLHRSAALLLLGCVITGVATTDRENFPVTLVVMLVAVFGATLSAAGHRRAAEASRQSRTRVRDLQRAADAAVQAERAHVARDLHDLVSHTVGLVAMQAAAAEVSWPRAPATVRDAVKTIERTAQRALMELDQLPGGHRPAPTRLPTSTRSSSGCAQLGFGSTSTSRCHRIRRPRPSSTESSRRPSPTSCGMPRVRRRTSTSPVTAPAARYRSATTAPDRPPGSRGGTAWSASPKGSGWPGVP